MLFPLVLLATRYPFTPFCAVQVQVQFSKSSSSSVYVGIRQLPLEKDIPTNGPWGRIGYEGTAKTDRERGYAWIQGSDLEAHILLVRIAYSKALEGGKAPVRVYYTEPLVDVSDYPGSMTSQDAFVSPVGILLPDGRMALVGGVFQDNYTPIPHNWLLYPGIPRRAAFPWGWIAAGMAVLLAGILLAWRKRRKERGKKAVAPEADKEASAKLMARIEQLMEEQQFYLRKDLRLTDIATELGTNSTYISACVNSLSGGNFPTYLNGFRVRHAQALMKEHPDWLLAQVVMKWTGHSDYKAMKPYINIAEKVKAEQMSIFEKGLDG